MCGITGIFNFDGAPVETAVLERMTDSLAHRGPDGEGCFTDGGLGLGHRRLAVIDLSPAAEQPMATPDGRFVITYNGEVYNFPELRVELEGLGHMFRSHGDTEVVLHALAEWGTNAIRRFNGMFALALWDRENRSLLLARDRYGIKPLYYHVGSTCFMFASEVKGLLAHGAPGPALDKEGLFEYLTFQNFFTDRTLFEGVRMLPAGCWAKILPGKGQDRAPTIVRYWDYRFEEPDHHRSDAEYLEELDQLFRAAVDRQLVSDVPVNAYLSGGVDSGAITAHASRQVDEMKSFTVGFEENTATGLEMGIDERARAEYLSYLTKTEHYQVVLKSGDMERVLPALVWHLDEPRVGQSYPNFFAASLASRFGKVVLTGLGGDELFGGYPWRYYRAVVNTDFNDYADKYYTYWQRLLSGPEIREVFRPIWSEVGHVSTRDIFHDVFTRHSSELTRPEDYINHSLYFEARTFLHGLLVVEDKLSMAHGLETRVPFLDNDMVDFAMRLPVRMKLGNFSEIVRLNENEPGIKTQRYFHKTRDGKLLLRKAMARYVPEETAFAVKQGFSGPDAKWFRSESIDFVWRTLFDSDAMIYAYLDRSAVETLVREHLTGQRNRRLLVWSLLCIEQWCRTFLRGAADADASSEWATPKLIAR